jgi:hypothetical protein
MLKLDANADNAIAADAVIENIVVADAVVDAILPFDTPTLDPNYKTGRDASSVWSTFTEENDPQKLKSATCKHCKTLVTYHQKIHGAKKHLMKCAKYTRTMNRLDASSRPDWYVTLSSTSVTFSIKSGTSLKQAPITSSYRRR